MAEGGGDDDNLLPWREAGSNHSSVTSSMTSLAHQVEDPSVDSPLESSDSPVCRDQDRPSSFSVLPEPPDELALDRGARVWYPYAVASVATQDARVDEPIDHSDESQELASSAEDSPDEIPRLASSAESSPDEIPQLASSAEGSTNAAPATEHRTESDAEEYESASVPCVNSAPDEAEGLVSSHSNSELESACTNCSASQQSHTPIAETESASSVDAAAIEEPGQLAAPDIEILRHNSTSVENPQEKKSHAPRRAASDPMPETWRDQFQRQAPLDSSSVRAIQSQSVQLPTIPTPEAVTQAEVAESPEESAPAPPNCQQDEAVDQVQEEQREATTTDVAAATSKSRAATVLIEATSSARTVGTAEDADQPQALEGGDAAAAAAAAPAQSVLPQLVAKSEEQVISGGEDGQEQRQKPSLCPANANTLAGAVGGGQMQRQTLVFQTFVQVHHPNEQQRVLRGQSDQHHVEMRLRPTETLPERTTSMPSPGATTPSTNHSEKPQRHHQPPISHPAQHQVEEQPGPSEPSRATPSPPQVNEPEAASETEPFFANSALSIRRQNETMQDMGSGVSIISRRTRTGAAVMRLQAEAPPAEEAASSGRAGRQTLWSRLRKFCLKRLDCFGHRSSRDSA